MIEKIQRDEDIKNQNREGYSKEFDMPLGKHVWKSVDGKEYNATYMLNTCGCLIAILDEINVSEEDSDAYADGINCYTVSQDMYKTRLPKDADAEIFYKRASEMDVISRNKLTKFWIDVRKKYNLGPEVDFDGVNFYVHIAHSIHCSDKENTCSICNE